MGPYPVQFAVPETLTLWEISASLWVSQGNHTQAPCAKVELDDTDLIAEKCTRGIWGKIFTLTDLEDTNAHTWTLTQSARDDGASGSLMIIIYQSPD